MSQVLGIFHLGFLIFNLFLHRIYQISCLSFNEKILLFLVYHLLQLVQQKCQLLGLPKGSLLSKILLLVPLHPQLMLQAPLFPLNPFFILQVYFLIQGSYPQSRIKLSPLVCLLIQFHCLEPFLRFLSRLKFLFWQPQPSSWRPIQTINYSRSSQHCLLGSEISHRLSQLWSKIA